MSNPKYASNQTLGFKESIHHLGRLPKALAFLGMLAVVLLAINQTQAQTSPVLTIKPSGTNQISITISNNIGAADYDLQWTPILASPNYPWTWAVLGTPGQTNFLLNLADFDTQTAFFRTILDTNAVPLWEAADPNNPATGILKVTIFSPANGATLN